MAQIATTYKNNVQPPIISEKPVVSQGIQANYTKTNPYINE